jgi:hypothetical protein
VERFLQLNAGTAAATRRRTTTNASQARPLSPVRAAAGSLWPACLLYAGGPSVSSQIQAHASRSSRGLGDTSFRMDAGAPVGV